MGLEVKFWPQSISIMIQILNKRASTHPNHCEDNYWLHETDEFIVGAVLDGCSTGIDSHFASTLFKRLFETEFKYYAGIPDENSLFLGIRTNLRLIKTQLELRDLHLLSTIIYFTYDKKEKELYVKFFGDGTIIVDGLEFTNDEQNMPEYIGYYLDIPIVDYINYLRTRPSYRFENINTFMICSDGIDSFVNVKNPHLNKEIAKDFILNSDQFTGLKTGLTKRFNILTNRNEVLKQSDELFCWDILDDLTVIHYGII